MRIHDHFVRLTFRFLRSPSSFLGWIFSGWLWSILIRSILLLFVCFRTRAGHLNNKYKIHNLIFRISINLIKNKSWMVRTVLYDIECNKRFAYFPAPYFGNMGNHQLTIAIFLWHCKCNEPYGRQQSLEQTEWEIIYSANQIHLNILIVQTAIISQQTLLRFENGKRLLYFLKYISFIISFKHYFSLALFFSWLSIVFDVRPQFSVVYSMGGYVTHQRLQRLSFDRYGLLHGTQMWSLVHKYSILLFWLICTDGMGMNWS